MHDPKTTLNRPPRETRRRGMAMVGLMLVLFGILTAALLGVVATTNGGAPGRSGLMANTGGALQMSGKRGQSTSAFNLAESGVEYTMQWLHSLPAAPSTAAAFTPGFVWGVASAGTLRGTFTPDPARPGDTFQVVLYPDLQNKPTNLITGTPDKAFLIESVGRSGGSTEILQAYVKTTSLSKYLVLVNNWTSDNYWVSGLSTFDGPVHDNNFKDPPDTDASGNPLSNGQLENVAWYDGAGSKAMGWKDAAGNAVPHPLFTYTGNDAYENSGAGVNWYRNNNFGGQSAPTGSDWQYVAAGGQNSVSYNTPPVPFPKTSNTQQAAAMGLPPGSLVLPPLHGVTVVPGGGVTIGGDVDQMTLSVDPADGTKQIIEVYQKNILTGKEDYTKITISKTGGTTAQKGTAAGISTPPSAASLITTASATGNNGVVYIDGNVGAQGDPKTGGLSGTVADNALDGGGAVTHPAALTIATNAADSLNIDGDITYHTARHKTNGAYDPEATDSNFVKNAGTLGVVSNNILITQTHADGSAIGDIETNGTFLAQGIFDVDHYANRAAHNWENMGGYLSSKVGVFGVFSNSTGQITNGMNNQFNYDARMRDNPPPFFPTNGNMYDVLSWRRVNRTLDGTAQAS